MEFVYPLKSFRNHYLSGIHGLSVTQPWICKYFSLLYEVITQGYKCPWIPGWSSKSSSSQKGIISQTWWVLGRQCTPILLRSLLPIPFSVSKSLSCFLLQAVPSTLYALVQVLVLIHIIASWSRETEGVGTLWYEMNRYRSSIHPSYCAATVPLCSIATDSVCFYCIIPHYQLSQYNSFAKIVITSALCLVPLSTQVEWTVSQRSLEPRGCQTHFPPVDAFVFQLAPEGRTENWLYFRAVKMCQKIVLNSPWLSSLYFFDY